MDDNKALIKIRDLKLIVDAILTHITDDLGKDEIELTRDFYWEIPEDRLYLLEEDPSGFTMGNLLDDLEFLKPLLSDREQAVSLMLSHVAPLLRYIALKVGQ